MTAAVPDPAHSDPARHGGRFAWALMLLALAGAVDATGFLHLRGLFVSFMSGNTTQGSVLAASGDWYGAGLVGEVIGAFVAGVAAGDLIAGEPPRRAGLVLFAEAALLLLAWRLPAGAGPLLALAMGMHNALALKAERVGLALTYVTGTLVHFGRAIAARLALRAHPATAWPYAAMWGALAAGGVAGAVGMRAIGTSVLAAIAALLALAGVAASIRERRRR